MDSRADYTTGMAEDDVPPAPLYLPPQARAVPRPGGGRQAAVARVLCLNLPLAVLTCLGTEAAVDRWGLQDAVAAGLFSAAALGLAVLTVLGFAKTRRVWRGLEGSGGLGDFAGALAILAVLPAALFFHAYPDFWRKGSEHSTRAAQGVIQDALTNYFGYNGGKYPPTLDALAVGGKYIKRIPEARLYRLHPDSAAVRYGDAADDAGGWHYDNVPGRPTYGRLRVNCTHTDSKGVRWDSY